MTKYTKDLNQWLQQTVWVSPARIEADRKWLIVDAEGKTLWRLAVDIAKKLQWKHKAYYCDMWDCGDYVIVTNMDKVVVTWNKMTDKIYYRHTGYKGHLREMSFEDMLTKHPERVMEYAVRWMLPKNKLRAVRLKRLKTFVGTDHPYAQFAPTPLYTETK